MKINGKVYSSLNEDFIVFPRPEGPIIIRARAIPNYKEFRALCPAPTAPMVQRAGQSYASQDVTDRGYLQAISNYEDAHRNYLVIKSLEPSNIEWETVKLEDWHTWNKWEEEFSNSCFSQAEINHIFALVWRVNSISDETLKEARANFLAGQEVGKS